MRYPVMIEAGDENTAWGVAVPDLPGCFSAGDTLDEALMAAEQAAAGWIDAALYAGRAIPNPSTVEDAMGKGDFAGWMVGAISVNHTR